MSFAIARISQSNGYLEFEGGGRWWPSPKCLFGKQIMPSRSEAVLRARAMGIRGVIHVVDTASEIIEFEDKGVYEVAGQDKARFHVDLDGDG